MQQHLFVKQMKRNRSKKWQKFVTILKAQWIYNDSKWNKETLKAKNKNSTASSLKGSVMLPLNKNCYFLVKSNQQSIHHPSKLIFVNTTLFDLVNAATWVCSFIQSWLFFTGVSNADQGSWIEPSEPTLIYTHWCIGSENLSKLKSFNQGFFDWIKIVDFFIVKLIALWDLKMTPKNNQFYY